LPAIIASTEWDSPTYAPGLADPSGQASLFVDLPAHFQAETDPDAVLRHVMGNEGSAPVSTASTPAAPEPAAGGMGLLALPELGDDIEIIRKPESISFRINSEILYSSAKADLSLEGLAVLRKLFPVLKGSEYTITVEGHTDALPVRGGQYPSNWELSGARAGRVVRYLAVNGVGSTRLRAIGYADTRPLASNNTEQGRASNRRVEIILEQPAPVGPR
jgi:chemotaxis protein MotB